MKCVQRFFTYIVVSKTVIPAKAGIQKDKKTGFPRIKYGAGSVKPGMTIKVKGLMTHNTKRRQALN